MNTPSIRTDGNCLVIEGQRINLPHPVEKVLSFRGLVIAMIEPPPGVLFNRNVMAFTEAAEPAWQIEESPHGTESDKPYVGIALNDDSELIASNWNGVDYIVNPENGRLTVLAFKK